MFGVFKGIVTKLTSIFGRDDTRAWRTEVSWVDVEVEGTMPGAYVVALIDQKNRLRGYLPDKDDSRRLFKTRTAAYSAARRWRRAQ